MRSIEFLPLAIAFAGFGLAGLIVAYLWRLHR
jgi:hypothetical protein